MNYYYDSCGEILLWCWEMFYTHLSACPHSGMTWNAGSTKKITLLDETFTRSLTHLCEFCSFFGFVCMFILSWTLKQKKNIFSLFLFTWHGGGNPIKLQWGQVNFCHSWIIHFIINQEFYLRMISVRPYSNFDILKILPHDWLLFWSAAEKLFNLLPSSKNPLLTQRETSNFMSHCSFTTE